MLFGVGNFKTAFEEICRCFEAKVAGLATFVVSRATKVARPATFRTTGGEFSRNRTQKSPQQSAGLFRGVKIMREPFGGFT